MDYARQIRDAFPELDEIADPNARQRVIDTWAAVLEESEFDHIEAIPWWPPYAPDVGEETQVDHVRDVTACAIVLADTLTDRRELELDRDLVVIGAFLHDISKPLEMTANGIGERAEWLSHPHYAVYVLERDGWPLPVQHIALAHSPRTGVEPRTIEAQIVTVADDIAAHAIFWENAGELKNVVK